METPRDHRRTWILSVVIAAAALGVFLIWAPGHSPDVVIEDSVGREVGGSITAAPASVAKAAGGLGVRGEVVADVSRRDLTGTAPTSAEITGRLVDQQGAPIACIGIEVLVSLDRGASHYGFITDSKGRFQMDVGRPAFGSDYRFWFGIKNPRSRSKAAAFVPLWKLRRGTNELGDLQVGRAPVLVSGTAICPDGCLASSIGLGVESCTGRPLAAPFSSDWSGYKFVVRSFSVPGERFRLTIRSRNLLPIDPSDSVEFVAGTTGVLFRPRLASTLTANFQVTASLRSQLEVDLLDAGTGEVVRREEGGVPSLASWQQSRVAPGAYRLRVQCGLTRQVVHLSATFQVESIGPWTQDLGWIDLQGPTHPFRARSVEVRVVRGRGGGPPFRHTWIEVCERGSGDWRARRLGRSSVRFALTGPVLVRACARGYLRSEARTIDGDHTFELAPAPKLAIRVRCPGLPDGMELGAMLRPTAAAIPDAVQRRLMTTRTIVDSKGVAYGWPAVPGAHEAAPAFRMRGSWFRGVVPWRFVTGGSRSVGIELEIPAATLAAVSEWARRLR